MPLLMEQGILAGRVVDAEEKWMNPGDTKKSSARAGKPDKMDCKCWRHQQNPACQENEGD